MLFSLFRCWMNWARLKWRAEGEEESRDEWQWVMGDGRRQIPSLSDSPSPSSSPKWERGWTHLLEEAKKACTLSKPPSTTLSIYPSLSFSKDRDVGKRTERERERERLKETRILRMSVAGLSPTHFSTIQSFWPFPIMGTLTEKVSGNWLRDLMLLGLVVVLLGEFGLLSILPTSFSLFEALPLLAFPLFVLSLISFLILFTADPFFSLCTSSAFEWTQRCVDSENSFQLWWKLLVRSRFFPVCLGQHPTSLSLGRRNVHLRNNL